MNTDRVHFGVKEDFCFYFGEKRVFLILFWWKKEYCTVCNSHVLVDNGGLEAVCDTVCVCKCVAGVDQCDSRPAVGMITWTPVFGLKLRWTLTCATCSSSSGLPFTLRCISLISCWYSFLRCTSCFLHRAQITSWCLTAAQLRLQSLSLLLNGAALSVVSVLHTEEDGRQTGSSNVLLSPTVEHLNKR